MATNAPITKNPTRRQGSLRRDGSRHHCITKRVLVIAVLVILMTTCVSMASARRMYPNRPGIPDENADGHYNDVADVATGNVVWMDAVCLANGAPS